MFTTANLLLYFGIMVAKIVEVSLMTVRVVLVTKGEKVVGAIIGFFEVMLWINIVSLAMDGIKEDPAKAVFYALGFALGNYFGIGLEAWLGIGVAEVQAIVKEEAGDELVACLREEGYAVTVVKGEGRTSIRDVLFLFVKRKRIKHVVDIIKDMVPESVITVSEAKPVYGGFGLIRK
ncbi:MAG: DUF2179 domain-containing protein [Clostridia bacterium]|nr:DUF2179 domain-containing protein [Clostridia bacterium]